MEDPLHFINIMEKFDENYPDITQYRIPKSKEF